MGRATVTESQLEAAAATFDLLSVPNRLSLLVLLCAGESDVSALAEASGQSIPATSQHLAKLRAAGLVSARRDGRRQLYRVDDPHVAGVIELMFKHIEPDGTLTGPDARRRIPRFDLVLDD